MMSNKKQGKSEQNNSIPKIVFTPNKMSRILSGVLFVLIELATVYYVILNRGSVSGEILIETINIGFAVVLAVVALAIAIFQSDKELLEKINSVKNIKTIYQSYIFSIFPIILELVLGYLVALIFKDVPQLISLYFVVTVVVLLKCISITIASLVAFLNVRD